MPGNESPQSGSLTNALPILVHIRNAYNCRGRGCQCFARGPTAKLTPWRRVEGASKLVTNMNDSLHPLFPLFSSVLFVIGAMLAKQATSRGASPYTATALANFCLAACWLIVGVARSDALPLAAWAPAFWIALAFVAGQLCTYLAFQLGDVSLATPVFGVKIILVAAISSLASDRSLERPGSRSRPGSPPSALESFNLQLKNRPNEQLDEPPVRHAVRASHFSRAACRHGVIALRRRPHLRPGIRAEPFLTTMLALLALSPASCSPGQIVLHACERLEPAGRCRSPRC